MFEWDDDKRLIALKKHGIDFLDAVEIFESDYLCLSGRSDIEIREIAVGYLDGSYLAVVFTMRGETIRIITVRKARRDEREAYDAYVARRDTQDEEPN
ncbi:BrnT family toxin [Roseovarius nitratireducens]|uniref:BrnT family toxin n=1 Tax=Roseovarius nitratireducens TaxID=2044597 RepID=UPI000CE25E7F|nr:BrnT family toxin [Roseovarius nitratireducens]